jgi:hypothetical protein
MVNGKTNRQEYERNKSNSSALDQCYNTASNPQEWTCETICIPVHLSQLPAKLSSKIKIYQVCRYEERKLKWKLVMLCHTHGVRLCMEVRPEREKCEPKLNRKDGTAVSDWSWTCQTTDTCWNKFHKFYQPCGLFNNNYSLQSVDRVKFSSFAYGSDLYQ